MPCVTVSENGYSFTPKTTSAASLYVECMSADINGEQICDETTYTDGT